MRQEVADCQEGIGILLDPFEIFVDALEDLLVVRVLKVVYPEAGLLVAVIFHKYIQDCCQEFALFLQGEVRNLGGHVLIYELV